MSSINCAVIKSQFLKFLINFEFIPLNTHTHSMSYTRSSMVLKLFPCPTTTSTTSSAPQNVTKKIVSWLIQPINFNPLSIRCMFCGSVCGLVVHGWWTDSMRYNSPNIKSPALVTITIAITWAMSSVGWQKPTFTRYGVWCTEYDELHTYIIYSSTLSSSMRLCGHTVNDGKLVFQTNLLRSIEMTIGDVWKRSQVRRLSDIIPNKAKQMKANHNVLNRKNTYIHT